METVEIEKSEFTEIKYSKFKMFLKFAKTVLYVLLGKRKWIMGNIPEITVDELNERIKSNQPLIIIDVRDKEDFHGIEGSDEKYGHIQNAMSFPIMEFRDLTNLQELSSFLDREIVTICPGGGMSLTAAEILYKAGFKDAKSLTGGMDLWHKKGYPTVTSEYSNIIPESESLENYKINSGKQSLGELSVSKIDKTLDARNLTCPLPILKSKKALKRLKSNQVLEILTTDPGSWKDIPAWAQVSGHGLISAEENVPREYRFLVKKIAAH